MLDNPNFDIENATCDRTFREEVFSLYPHLRESQNDARFFWHAMFSNRPAKNTRSKLYEIFKELPLPENSHWNLSQELEQQFKKWGHGKSQLICDEAKGKKDKNRKTRVYIHSHWPVETMGTLLAREKRTLPIKSERVYWLTGNKYHRPGSIARPEPVSATAEGKFIIQYLDGVGARNFCIDKFRYSKAAEHIDNTRDDTILDDTLCHLKAIGDLPRPLYFQRETSSRVFARGSSLQGISSDIRAVLFPHWIDLDLKNAHLAIVAKILKLDDVRDSLNDKSFSLWNDLTHRYSNTEDVKLISGNVINSIETKHTTQDTPIYGKNIDILALGPAPPPDTELLYNETFKIPPILAAKSVFKVATYAMCFGANRGAVSKYLTNNLGQFGKDVFWETPLVASISAGVKDYIGSHGHNAGRDLALLAQAEELKIIHELYKLAATSKNFQIVLHSHDGVSIVPKSRQKRNRAVKICKDVVAEYCQEKAIPTWLEEKEASTVYVKKAKFGLSV